MALQQEREAIAEASLAHDMAVRRALAACEALATASLQRHVALDEAALERVTEALG